MRRTLLVWLACCLAAAVLPAAAHAVPNVTKSGNTLTYTGNDDPATGELAYIFIDHFSDASTANDVLVMIAPDATYTPNAACTHDPAQNTVRCPLPSSGVTRVIFNGLAGDDNLYSLVNTPVANPNVNNLFVELNGGDGNDFLYGGTSSHAVPVHVHGGAGADFMFGSDGPDTLDGGEENDIMFGYGGGDVFTGGGGFDQVSYSDRAADRPVEVTIDGAANDGTRAPALPADENDNVMTDVEDVSGTAGDDKLTGGTGANTLDGGAGNDSLDGGDGFDSYQGGPGVDTIRARDGRSERIDCGDGADSAFTDNRDVHSGCETVSASGALEPDQDGDGVAAPTDCDDTNAAVGPGKTEVPNNGLDDDCVQGDRKDVDADGDGFFVPKDCNDANKAAFPGAPEVYGNDVDEDCNFRKDPLVSFTSRVLGSWRLKGGTFRVSTLFILNPAPNATLTITCSGGKKKGCPFKKRTRKIPANSRQFRLESGLRKAKLKPGAKLDIRMLRKDAIGRVTILKFSRNKDLPTETRLCMAPTDKKPRKC